MVAAAVCSAVAAPMAGRKTFTGAAVAKQQRVVCRVNRRVECSASKKEALVAGVTVGVATMMANPLVAEAAVSPSLKNLLNSVLAGGVVLAGIVGAITLVSNFDPIRKQ